MSKEKPTADTVHGSRVDLKATNNLKQKVTDQAPDLRKSINVFNPTTVKNPFLQTGNEQPTKPAQQSQPPVPKDESLTSEDN